MRFYATTFSRILSELRRLRAMEDITNISEAMMEAATNAAALDQNVTL